MDFSLSLAPCTVLIMEDGESASINVIMACHRRLVKPLTTKLVSDLINAPLKHNYRPCILNYIEFRTRPGGASFYRKAKSSNKATQTKYSVSRPIGYGKVHKGHG